MRPVLPASRSFLLSSRICASAYSLLRRAQRARKRLEENERLEQEATQGLMEQINELVQRAEKLGEEGKVEESLALLQQVPSPLR